MSKRYESDTFRTRLYDYLTFDSTIPELLRVKKPYGKSRRSIPERLVLMMTRSWHTVSLSC